MVRAVRQNRPKSVEKSPQKNGRNSVEVAPARKVAACHDGVHGAAVAERVVFVVVVAHQCAEIIQRLHLRRVALEDGVTGGALPVANHVGHVRN